MRQHALLRTAAGLTALTALLAACSDDTSDDAAPSDTTSSPTSATTPAAAEDLPDGVVALPGPDDGQSYADLAAGRYRVALSDTLGFDIDVPDGSSAHENGLFISHDAVVVKTELADEGYGLPADACSDHTIVATGPSVEDLARAMVDLAPYRVSDPVAVELGGGNGVYLEATLPASYDASGCSGDGTVALPGNPGTVVSASSPYVGRWWILDVDGQRVVVQQNCWDCAPGEFDADAGIADSITFTPAS